MDREAAIEVTGRDVKLSGADALDGLVEPGVDAVERSEQKKVVAIDRKVRAVRGGVRQSPAQTSGRYFIRSFALSLAAGYAMRS